MVLAATNRPSELDEAILRRLPQAFEIGMPNQKDRAEILKVVLKGERVERNIDYDYLAALAEGYTGSDLLELCKKAAYLPIRDLLDEEKRGKKTSVSMPGNFIFNYLTDNKSCYIKSPICCKNGNNISWNCRIIKKAFRV